MRELREQGEWGPVYVDGEGFGYYDDDEIDPCNDCEKLTAEEDGPEDCQRCEHMAVVYFAGLAPAPYCLIPFSLIEEATQEELEQAWKKYPGAWSFSADDMARMGMGVTRPKRKPRTPVNSEGPVVYFIQAGESGPIKIGFTERPVAHRLSNLQTASADELRALVCVSGTRQHESDLHFRFRDHHIRGEWFKPAADLLEYIASLREEVDR